MNYEQVQKLSDEQFRRLTGVKRETFLMMVEILKNEYEKRRQNHKYRGGRKPALSIENKLLLVFAYFREYSSMFHTTQKFRVGEKLGWQALKSIENTLIKHKKFALPSKRELLKSDTEFEVVVIDATETPCERQKKNRKNSILARKKGTHFATNRDLYS